MSNISSAFRFYEADDKDKFLKTYHVFEHNKLVQGTSEECCPICYSDEKLNSLPCGHAFCIECWPRYLETKVSITIILVVNN